MPSQGALQISSASSYGLDVESFAMLPSYLSLFPLRKAAQEQLGA